MIKVYNAQSLYSALYKAVDFCKENAGEEIEIIVPDKLSLFMEKFLFEHMNTTSSFNVKVSTLNRFAKKTCFVEKEKQISKVGSILLIHKILNENLDKLEVLKNKAYSFSYAEDIFRTIGQLKASKITCDEMKNFSSGDIRLLGKIKDLALIYGEYENKKAGLLDASDMFLMSTLSVSKGQEHKQILFVGFDDFTAIEYAIIERLAIATNVFILNYNSKEKNRVMYNDEVITQLKNVAYINQLPFEVEEVVVNKSELKKFLESNLFSLTNEKFILKDEIIKVYSGNNFVDELEFVARDIRQKILNGARYDDFGVAVFNLESKESKIREIFSKYEINYYIDSEISINKSVLYKFFAEILRYNLEGYSLSNLIDIINSPFFRLEKRQKRDIIQKLLAVNFRGGITENFNLDIDNDIKEKLVAFVECLTFDGNSSAEFVIDLFKNLDNMINFSEVMETLTEDNRSKILLSKSKDVLLTLFDDILRFNSDINARTFFDIFTHIANVVKINNLPLSLDAVKVVDANNSLEIFNELYLVGATHENAPNLKYDCGIILDGEIEKLNFANKLSPTIAHINKLAKLRLYNSSNLFERELVVTYSNTQSELVKELLGRIQVESQDGVINIVPLTRFNFEKYIALSNWDSIEFACKNKIDFDKFIKNNEKVIKNKDFSQISNKNLKIFEDVDIVSATMLENYFKCPFYAFLINILKVKPRIENEILSFDIGNVLHEIMFKYYKLNKNVGDIYEFCRNEVFKCVQRDDRLKLNANSPILINLIDEAVRVINAINYMDENSNFIPKFFELDFKGDNALKLKNVSVIGKVDRVDIYQDMFRIVDYKSGKADASLKELYFGNKLQLFLYSCAMENMLKKRGVGSFYLPLHNAYTKELGNTYSLKGFYLAEDFVVKAFDKRLEANTKSDIVNVRINKSNSVVKTIGHKELDINELNMLKCYSKSVSELAVDEFKTGYIKPSPSDVSKPCEFCPFSQVCLRNSCGIEYRKTNKVNLDSFKEVENESV